jgi:hypothetical protein
MYKCTTSLKSKVQEQKNMEKRRPRGSGPGHAAVNPL